MVIPHFMSLTINLSSVCYLAYFTSLMEMIDNSCCWIMDYLYLSHIIINTPIVISIGPTYRFLLE